MVRTLLSCLGIFLFCHAVFGCFSPLFALKPEEVLVLANRKVPAGLELARYYMEKRGIPSDHLLELLVTDGEECTRKAYEKKIASPVREYIKKRPGKEKICCLLIMYGLPLKIAPPEMESDDIREYKRIKRKKKELEARLSGLGTDQKKEREEIKGELTKVKNRMKYLTKTDQGASLDSEIALVLQDDYPLSRWVPNPFFAGYHNTRLMKKRDTTLLVSRLDGPSPSVVRRIIDDTLETERYGLKGKAYFDARWPRTRDKADGRGRSGYQFYDTSIYMAADIVKRKKVMPVIVNNKPGLFKPGECPDAALYCGWYSLGKYMDAFSWTKGSVGYHIASAECRTLKRRGSQVWCKRMLEEGVAATLGPVNEPYVQAFPVPELFFRFLLDGYWTLAECYALSKPFWSWQMVLIGDPLYRPFKQTGI